jgi:hypothetical protein
MQVRLSGTLPAEQHHALHRTRPVEAHSHPRTRLGVFEVDRLGQCADDSGAKPRARLGVAPASPLIPDGDRHGRVADPALDIEIDARGVLHRVCRRFGDGKLDIGDDVPPYPRLVAPAAYLRSRP